MDPITFSLLLALVVGGGGYLGYSIYKKAHPDGGARQITLDAGLPDADKQAVIAAIMTATDPARLDALAAQYGAYPWTAYELKYRAWELRGKQGAAPEAPQGPGQATPAPAQPGAPAAASGGGQPTSAGLAASAIAAAQSALAGLKVAPGAIPTQTPAAPAAPSGPPPGVPLPPFNVVEPYAGAWQTDKAYILQYQGALKYLAWKLSKPAWDPIKVDGGFGPETKAAVMAFQADNGLSPVDGEAGKGTAAAITASLASAATMTSGTPSHTGMDPMGQKPPFMNPTQEEVAGVPVDDDVQGVGPGEHREGVAGPRMGEHREEVGAAAASAPATVIDRPKGGWYIKVRPSDKAWPRTIAKIGSGLSQSPQGALKHLADINPHLAPGGVMRELGAGDEVNVPESWAKHLKAKGFDVQNDT